MNDILNTGVKVVKNVNHFEFIHDDIKRIKEVIETKKNELDKGDRVIIFIDDFFENNQNFNFLESFEIIYVNTKNEPSVDFIDDLMVELIEKSSVNPSIIVAIGGGVTMDTAKACANLFTNHGKACEFQGWDLVKKPAIFKIAIPTISGTGAEATRTCVLTNYEKKLKLGMNSDYTVFDYVIMAPSLSKTVPRNQYFYTGMDAFIHCIESIEGQFRNPIGDEFSSITIKLCREVFNSKDMMSDQMREKLMLASYFGGCSIGMSYVGVVHPLSAGLSIVLGTHHCIANCIVMNSMEEFYKDYYLEFHEMAKQQSVEIPKGLAKNLTDEQYDRLYQSSIIHEKPLYNALGKDFKDILNKKKVKELFKKM